VIPSLNNSKIYKIPFHLEVRMDNKQFVGYFYRDFDIVSFHIFESLQKHVMRSFVVPGLLFLIRNGKRNLGSLFKQVEDSVDL
jgi:hypothetical protein